MGFEVANEFDKSVMLWHAEMDQLEEDLKAKETIEARAWDLWRNNDLMRGLVEKQIDAIVGSKVVLQLIPDYETLGITREQAKEWARSAQRAFHLWADCPENWISSDRKHNFTRLCRAACRSLIMNGEISATREWRPSPLGFKTCFNLFSPQRIKTPSGSLKNTVFHGVEMDRFGAATGYHIESADPRQKKSFGRKRSTRYSRYNKFGWPQVFHIYEPIKPEYPRGISRLACVLKKIKQLDRFHEADLDKAIITTNYVFAISSDEDPESVADMLSGANNYGKSSLALEGEDDLPADVKDKRQEILDQITTRYIETTGGQVIHLFTGEDLKTVAPPNTITSSEDFARGHSRAVANGAGISYELATGDFRGVNYSGGQLSMGIYEHSANIQRELYLHDFARMIVRSWLDEAIDKGIVPLFKDSSGNSINYWQNREAYSRCVFTGSKRVYVDPFKEARSNNLKLSNGTTSRSAIINEAGGDPDSVLSARSNEAEAHLSAIMDLAEKMGLNLTEDQRIKILIDYMSGDKVEIKEGDSEQEEVINDAE